MGAEPWSHFAPYEPSIEASLDKLRVRVFESGSYRGSELQPATPEEAVENMAESGTASILDIHRVGASPDFCSACPLNHAKLTQYFGTDQPTHEQVASTLNYYEDIERGHAIYVVVFKEGKPDEYFFAGYSFD